MSSRRTRKTRRKVRAILKHGPEARPKHTGRSGRTGQMHARKLRASHHG